MEERDVSLPTCNQERESRREWEKILRKEEIFWKQKSRVQWLQEMDRYTSFFHVFALKHKKRNQITKLHNEQGVVVNTPTQISLLVVDYF